MGQITKSNVKEGARSDETAENYHTTALLISVKLFSIFQLTKLLGELLLLLCPQYASKLDFKSC